MTNISLGEGAAAMASGDAGSHPAGLQPAPILLPPPRTEGGMALQTALKLRRSTRDYADKPLSLQQLSDLLWSACGVNRNTGERTAPYWRHRIVLDLYLLQPDGVSIYDAISHALAPHMKEDLRALAG
jgi:hypothetical protein